MKPGGGTRPHRQRVAQGGAADSKKNEIKPWRRVGWVIPSQGNGDFAAAMERVLNVYRRPLGSGVPRGLKPESIKLYLIEGRYGDRGLLQIELTAFRRDDDLFQRLAKGRRRAELYSGKNSR